jgi:regulator of PEP synthase PpsR (kinase-PPPase family)
MKKKLNLYLISDSSGETVISVGNSVISQFANLDVTKYMWPMVRTDEQIAKIASDIKNNPGVVLYTMANKELLTKLEEACQSDDIKFVPAIEYVTKDFTEFLGVEPSFKVSGAKHIELTDKYFNRIEAINFAISHDDGHSIHDIKSADIVLVGVSRASKSPTAFYLAQRGLKVANVPYIRGVGLRFDPKEIKNSLVIGLIISPERLKQIRINRMQYLGGEGFTKDYIDDAAIREEIREVRQIIAENNWPYIDVTGKAIEETAAQIINIYFEKIGARQSFGW